jgi:hypothetical protein
MHFDYDVFLSFASADEEIVRPVWQKLCFSGLRVFWSDATLKQNLGESWSTTIETALERSRHFLLMASHSAVSSNWVQREYSAFYNHCYQPGIRRLIPIAIRDFKVAQLPLFLRDLQSVRLDDANCLERIIELLGGEDIEQLKKRLAQKEDENHDLRAQLDRIQLELQDSKEAADLAQSAIVDLYNVWTFFKIVNTKK